MSEDMDSGKMVSARARPGWRDALVASQDGTRFRLRAIAAMNAFLDQIESARQSANEKAHHV